MQLRAAAASDKPSCGLLSTFYSLIDRGHPCPSRSKNSRSIKKQ